jgi:hypothetical protein
MNFIPLTYGSLLMGAMMVELFMVMGSTVTGAFLVEAQQLKTIMRSKGLWTTLLFVALFHFSPGFTTPLFYKQTDELHFSNQPNSLFWILRRELHRRAVKVLGTR